MPELFRKCSTCKKDIHIGDTFQVCSVSTCRAKATNYAFCSVECWDAHLPIERHRAESAYALERRASRAEAEAYKTGEEKKRVIAPEDNTPRSSSPGSGQVGTINTTTSSVENEILVVASKVKKYISDKSGMNTSAGVFEALTERIKELCLKSIEEAKRQGRKTVMDRDVP